MILGLWLARAQCFVCVFPRARVRRLCGSFGLITRMVGRLRGVGQRPGAPLDLGRFRLAFDGVLPVFEQN